MNKISIFDRMAYAHFKSTEAALTCLNSTAELDLVPKATKRIKTAS